MVKILSLLTFVVGGGGGGGVGVVFVCFFGSRVLFWGTYSNENPSRTQKPICCSIFTINKHIRMVKYLLLYCTLGDEVGI